MNSKSLKYESLSFARELQKTGGTIDENRDAVLRMQVVRTGEVISSLYSDDLFEDSSSILESEEKAIKEAIYWIYMLYSAHCISVQVYNTLKTSADHLLKLVLDMMNRNETEH